MTDSDPGPSPAISTAAALGWFRDELIDAGFTRDEAIRLVTAATTADVTISGLQVHLPPRE